MNMAAANDGKSEYLARLLCKTAVEEEAVFIDLWQRIGFNERQIQKRCEDINRYFKEILDSMKEEEQENCQRLLANIERLCKEEYLICKELGEEPLSFTENEGLLSMESRHKAYLETLQERKEEIMFEIRELIAEDEMLSDRLEVQPFGLSKNRIPSNTEKTALKDHIRQLSAEIATRKEEFKRTKKELEKLFEELEMAPRNTAEMEIFTADIATIKLSSARMQTIKDLHEELSTRLSQNKRRFVQLQQQLSSLWDRLNVEQHHRDRVLQENATHAPSSIANLSSELQRCEELKRQNMKLFIEKIRAELTAAWDRCYVGSIEREDFAPFYSEVLSDEVLAIHEMEVDKYNEFYKKNHEIFGKIEKRNRSWKKMRDLESISKDPARLFANRGCKLLQEEKERKKIQQELPRVEGELVLLLNQYEQQNGQPLKIYGEDFRMVIERQWEAYQEEKENEKQKRLKEKQEKLEEERKGGAKPVTPMKRRFGPGTTLKAETASPKAKRKCPIGTAAPSTVGALTRQNLRSLARPNGTAAAGADPNDTVGTTYSVFTAGIEGKSEKEFCRSSVAGTPPFASPHRFLPPHLASSAAAAPSSSRAHLRRSKSNPVLNASPRVTPGKNNKLAIPRNLRPFL